MSMNKLIWSIYKKKQKLLMLYGAANGLIKFYDKELMDKLRHIYYGGLPASILLLHEGLCNGKCYDRAPLLTLALDEYDYKVVYANIDSIKLNPIYSKLKIDNPSYAEHCFVEVTDNQGITWVFDTSSGLMMGIPNNSSPCFSLDISRTYGIS